MLIYGSDTMSNLIPQPDRCIACTTCTVVCPVAQATPNFLGPRMMGPAHERFRLVGFNEDESLHYCSNCKNCDISCPCDVPISTFIMRARADVSKDKKPSTRDWLLAHGEVLGRWLTVIPAWMKNFGMRLSPVRLLLDKAGIGRKAPLPDFAAKSFRGQFPDIKQPAGLPRKVVFFPGCFVDLYDPECGRDIVSVLNRAGYEVLLPKGFICCGLPQVANGFWEDAKSNAATNLAELKKWKEQGVPVLTGCTSCSLMFKDDYEQYFPELIPHNVSPALADACEFLLGCIERGELSMEAGSKRESRGEAGELGAGGLDAASDARRAVAPDIVYHAPCHLRAQGMGLTGFDLLQKIPALGVRNANAGCCGISGSYGFKTDKYDISMRVGAKLFKTMRESGAPLSASECGTCRVQMRHGGGLEAVHPITVLRRFLDGSVTYLKKNSFK